jgi:hypothetical protein
LPGGGAVMIGACMVWAAAKPVAPRRMTAAERVLFMKGLLQHGFPPINAFFG